MSANLSRRDFLKLLGASTGGLVLAVYLDGCAPAETFPQQIESTSTVPAATATPNPPPSWAPNIYLKVDELGFLTIVAFRSEMGQGIRTALAMLIADELDIEWAKVRIEQALADPKYGDQLTGGSASLSGSGNTVRLAAATARQMLVNAAAQTWKVDPAKCTTEAGQVIYQDGQKKIAYGELVATAAKLDLPTGVKVKDKSQFKLIGTGLGHWDAPQIVTGKAIYGLDVRLPGMLFAALARCPVFGGKLAGVDSSAAETFPGVRHVLTIENQVAVVAENSWAAIQGRNALKVTWDEGIESINSTLSSENFIKTASASLTKSSKPNPAMLEAVYYTPYEAHATMEPMDCVAYVHDGICEVWAPTQNPQAVRRDAAMAAGISQEKVIVNVPLIGGGFGRRLQTDYAVEAVKVSKLVNAPVQVVWTRADDLQHDFYQALTVQYFNYPLEKSYLPSSRTSGGFSVPTGAWRSVDHFMQAFGLQCFIDELAQAKGLDPLDLRLKIYAMEDRALAVIKLVAEKADWGKPLPAGEGRGLAYHATFGVTHVAQVAEVAVGSNGKVWVKRVVCAVDCGQVVNPDNVAAQMEGGIVFGLTAALKAESILKNGRMQESSFAQYPLLQMDEMPKIEVYLVESNQPSSGIGEMGVPPAAPAVANAIFAATGKRVRHIPIRPDDLK